jgi:hypothetical protein
MEGRNLAAESFHAESASLLDNEKGLPFTLIMGLEKALKDLGFDFNGHWKDGNILYADFKKPRLNIFGTSMIKKDAEDLIAAAKSGVALDRWISLGSSLRLSGLRTCSFCGEKDFEAETNGASPNRMGNQRPEREARRS